MPKRIIKKPIPRRIVLRLPDLDHSKSAVLNSLSSPRSRRNYKFAMEQFISWYCSEPRLALNRTVVLRFRLHLESLGLATGTINQRLAAVRRLAYEAADSGLVSPELAAGIRRVKGVKQLGCRAGNWLNREQAQSLLEKADGLGLRNVRDVAMIAILLGCSLRRAELAALRKEDNRPDSIIEHRSGLGNPGTGQQSSCRIPSFSGMIWLCPNAAVDPDVAGCLPQHFFRKTV
jgi:integrase